MSYESEVLADSALVYLRYQETSGASCPDSSGNGFDGTAQGTFTRNDPSEPGITPGIDLGGSTADYVSVPDQPALDLTTNFTLEGWFKLDAAALPATYYAMFSKGNTFGGGTNSWVLYLDPTLGFSLFVEALALVAHSDSAVFPDDQDWHHVVCAVTSPTSVAFYVDGTLVGTNYDSNVAFGTNAQPLQFGMDNNGGTHSWPWKGALDENAVYGTVLDATRVAVHYAAGIATPCNPPVNDVAPSISSPTLEVGDTATITPGSWSGDPTIDLTYQWYRFCGSGPEELIVGETALTYEYTDDDVDCDVFARETASNGCAPDGEADTNMLGPIDCGIPTEITPPTITGVPSVGHTLEATHGTYRCPPILSYDMQWYLDCGGGPNPILGETSLTIETTDAMIDCDLTFGEKPTNADGEGTESFSNTIGPVQPNVPAAVRFYQSPPWRFVVVDLQTFETLSFLDHIMTDRLVTFLLNAPAVTVGTVPSDDPEVNIPWPDADDDPFVAEGTRALLGFRREGMQGTDDHVWVIRFAGIIMQLEDAAESDDAFTHITAFDPWQYLFSRPVCNLDGSLPGVDGISFTQTRVDVIAGILLRNTISNMGAVGIDAGGTYGGTAFYEGTIEECPQIDINFAQGTTVGEAWQTLTNLDECDILLTPIYDPINRPGYLVEFNIYPQAGEAKDDAIFAWDKPSRSLGGISRVTLGGTDRATNVKYFAGIGGNAPNGQNIPVQSDAAAIAKFGEYWRVTFWPAQNVGNAVLSLAQSQLALSKNGKTTVAISPAPERSPIPFEDYYLGDRVPVYASKRLREEVAGYQRIYGIPIQIADDETETITSMLTAIPSAA